MDKAWDFPIAKRALNTTNEIEMAAVEGIDLSPIEQGLFEIDIKNADAIESYNFMVQSLESRAEFYQRQADEFAGIAKTIEGVVSRYQTFVKRVMIDSGTPEVLGKSFRFKLTNVKPKLVINDGAEFPEYMRTETKQVLDKDRIKQDLELGVPVEGARLEQSYALKKYPIKGLK